MTRLINYDYLIIILFLLGILLIFYFLFNKSQHYLHVRGLGGLPGMVAEAKLLIRIKKILHSMSVHSIRISI